MSTASDPRPNVEGSITVTNLGKIYEPFPAWLRVFVRSQVREPLVALDDVSFTVQSGTICGVIGPNGAGKSTLFKILTGLTTPSSGSATVLGLDVVADRHAVQRLIGYMPADERSLQLRQTCVENLAFHGRLRGLAERTLRKRIDETLDIVGLADARDRAGFALSSGMRARLQLGRAVLHDPRVLILDEPTSSVDPVSSYHMLNLVKDLAKERNLIVLISSHRVEEIEALHDNLVILEKGRLLHHGDLDVLRDLWAKPVIEIDSSVRTSNQIVAILDGIRSVRVVGQDAGRIRVSTTLSTGKLLAALDGQLRNINSVTERRAPLREILAALSGRNSERADDAR